mmetsp:Transcript_8225/g.7365  ORF Transcript_8225/g.7365 Transcript_8225/m.7365 type:complete len:592 (+) Transcript_8225:63-1838(+)|eukprot:CAMPEP_0196763000 /NCGR_PEP_ID=MMETSP1095-20130614/3205_1 /TAXON_ID=96789 ORGANISM="Chromulina nebulosa, Strain UTEXLB2642" /NCGR_SAMPLE_ID=MMETSP1095 /ASSEMBLY_ACC=CAM_ASM_000446 /LENGTH=591 /DNA_ID=CAMNT_0042115251 /DNA_START=32 /DNA_END=1807 /DNA_ORIENTATION=-
MSSSSIAEAVARAKEIAARLSSNSDLGKRKFDDISAPGLGSIKQTKVYIPTKQYPDVNFIGLLIGPRGETQRQMQERTGAKLSFRGKGAHRDGTLPQGHPDDNDDLHVNVEGTDEAVERCVKELEQILFNPEEAMKLKAEQLKTLGITPTNLAFYSNNPNDYQEELKVPNPSVGIIIGKGGENIVKLHQLSGASMLIAKETDMKPGDTHRSIMLKGSPENVAVLRAKIEEMVATRSSVCLLNGTKLTPDNNLNTAVVMKVAVPNDKVGYIIGKGGMNVKNIQEKTKTTLFIPQQADEDNPSIRTISIGGDTKEAVQAGHSEIFLCIQQANIAGVGAGPTVAIVLPDERVGSIIGRGGSNIKDLMTRHRVKVYIPQAADPGTNPPVRTCTISGTVEGIQACRYEIEMQLQGQREVVPSTPLYTQPYGTSMMPSMYGQPYYDPTQALYAQQFGYYNQLQPQTVPAVPTTPKQDTPTDPKAYYNDFWQYATYYGEALARQYYGAWSPPAGTAPPPGITVAADPSTATTTASATTNTNSKSQNESDSNENNGSSNKDSSSSSSSEDPWEAYKKQYAEWYESHGKFIGADPNPPQA